MENDDTKRAMTASAVVTLEWSDHVQAARGCPPPDASATSGYVYRRLMTAGYKTHAERPEISKMDLDPCECAGLSCYTNIEALKARANVNKWQAKKPIVKAELSADHGCMKQTSDDPAHYTVWFRRKYIADLATMFVAV